MTKIAFVSCAYATYRPVQPAWDQIRAAKPDLLIMLGDNAYMNWDGPVWDFKALEDCYRAQFDIPGFRKLIESVPTLAVWDDHDCGPNDTCGAEAPPDFLATTREKFDRWMGFARNNNRPHMYCSYRDIPEVQVLMLDGRTYRTGLKVDRPVLFGEEQEQWLRRQLDPRVHPQPSITIVATGSPFNKYDNTTRYTEAAKELRRLLGVEQGNGEGVGRRALYLGGDIHENYFFTDESGFHEVVSSGVACFKPRSGSKLPLPPERFTDNWGLITIDDEKVKIDFHANAHTNGNPAPRVIDRETWKVISPSP